MADAWTTTGSLDQPDVLVGHRMRAMQASLVATIAALVAVGAYAFLPGSGDRGAILFALGLQAAATAGVAVLPWPRLFESGHAEPVLRGYSLLTVLLISLSVGLTGGGTSSLHLLYALTAVFFAVVWSLRWQAVLAIVSGGGYLVAVGVTGFDVDTATLVFRLSVFAIVTGLAAYLSIELTRQLVENSAARAELEVRAAESERLAAAHERLALHDPLTGLPNRRLFADRVRSALAEAAHTTGHAAVLVLDLDGFKDVNDSFGHDHGDALLREIGPRLHASLRASDVVARMGGDEFAVLLPGLTHVSDAAEVAEKVVAAVERPFHIAGLEIGIEGSVGIVVFPEHGEDVDALLRHADTAMYRAKTERAGWTLYSVEADADTAPRRASLLGELRRALEADELVVHYQPKVRMADGSPCGAEALVRWEHPERGLVPPAEFIPLVEQTALIGPLTRAVLDRALAQARRWRDAGRELPVAVNVSVRNLHSESFAADVRRLLRRHGVPASALELEVTESAIMTQPRRAAAVLEELGALGVRIVLDDFGTGYSSLGYLARLPVAELKIDRSFVREMGDGANGSVIVRSVVNIGHNLGLTVVAEGVEDEASWERLVSYGCDVAQGYLVSRPMPAPELTRWLAAAAADRSLSSVG